MGLRPSSSWSWAPQVLTVTGVAVGVCMTGVVSSHAEDSSARVERQTYIADTYPLDPCSAQPERPRVAVAGGQPIAHALLQTTVPAGSTSAELTMTPMSPPSGATTPALTACPVTEPWTLPVDRAAPPSHDCGSLSAPLDAAADGTWRLQLSPFLTHWRGTRNYGIAVVPAAASADASWTLEFDPAATAITAADTAPGSAAAGPRSSAPIAAEPPVTSDNDSSGPLAVAVQPGPSLPDHQPADTSPVTAPFDGTVGAAGRPAGHVLARASGEDGRPWWPWALWLLAAVAVVGSRTRRGAAALDGVPRRMRTRISRTLGPLGVLQGRRGRTVRTVVMVVAAYLVLRAGLPQGLPLGVVGLGALLGSLTGLTALGIVLVFRVVRAINMAQAEIGAIAASTAIILVTGQEWAYLIAVPVGLCLAALTGLGVESTMHRFRHSPRLIVTVATIGIAQVLAAANLIAPRLVSQLAPSYTFTTPFGMRFAIGPVTFTGDAIAAAFVVPVVLVALIGLLTRTNTGRALRAVADSTERAQLVGIPVRRVLRITWVTAALLSGVAAILAAPILGPQLGAAAGPEALLAPLAAATLGKMEHLPRTLLAGIAIGIAQQGFFWSYPRSSTVDVLLFAVILGSLLLTRPTVSRTSDSGLGQYSAVAEPRPVPRSVLSIPGVRATRVMLLLAVVGVSVGAPVLFDESNLIVLTYIAIFGIVAVSLVVLTGWAGQVTLGQFALAGVGGCATALLVSTRNLDLFLALGVGAVAAALCAVVVGLPILRLSGQFAAVATLAFAVPASTFLLNPSRFPSLNPMSISRPVLLGRYPLDDTATFYYLCVALLAVSFLAARNLRRSRVGRAMIAVRDNERTAAGWSIAATRIKLVAFAVSGAMAGIAGGLYTIGLRGVPFQGFSPLSSLEIFTMVVVGGLGSLSGAILGAIYVGVVQSMLGGAAQLFATGAGLLLLLLVLPEGIGGLVFRIRDGWYGWLAGRSGITLFPTAAGSTANAATEVVGSSDGSTGLLEWQGLTASYGKLQVLFEVTGKVADGETLALLGTNGAGKSTVLRVLGGVLPADSGSVRYDGRDITEWSPQDRLRNGIVTVPGGRGVFPSLTVAENLRLFAWTVDDTTQEAARRAEVYATFPRLRERAGEKAAQLSGGEQQMLALAQAIMCKPRLLLIDELTHGLAPATVTTLLGVLEQLRADGVSVILVEQSLNTAAAVAMRCNFMERGQNRYDGSIQDLMGRDDLARAVFLTDAATPAHSRTPACSSGLDEQDAPIVLSVRSASKHFGGVTALDRMSLAVAAGSIVGLIGPNGAGKTTLLDVCSGFVSADEGQVLLHGQDVTALPAHARADLGLGRIFQDARLIPSLTVREVLATSFERHIEVREPIACMLRLGACSDSERAVDDGVQQLLDSFGLEGYADSFVKDLSTGTRRVVEIACSVAHAPSVLLLDEPTAGVAQRETEALADTLLAAQRDLGLTMVVVEHDLSFVAQLADYLVCMELGAELSSGPPDRVLDDPKVLEAYFGMTASTPSPPPRPRPSPPQPIRRMS